MGQRTRSWRRRGEVAARWTLTLLLVALVGVTVASGWYEVMLVRAALKDDGPRYALTFLTAGRGSVQWLITSSSMPEWKADSLRGIQIHRYPPTWLNRVGQPREPLNFWRLHVARDRGSFPLMLPTALLALPTLLLWYRRFRRRRRRGACVECGYDLAGLIAVEGRIVCPECGAGNAAGRGGGRATMLKAKTP